VAVTVTGPYTVAAYPDYVFYKFTGAGSVAWTKPDDLETCDISVVGGGAGSSGVFSCHGYGAGYCNNQNGIIPSTSTTVVVGNGFKTAGASGPGEQSAFGSYTANGGATPSGGGGSGGSGGGSFAGGDGGSNGSAGQVGNGGYAAGTGQGTTTYTCDGILRCGGGGAGGNTTTNDYGVGGAGGGGTGAMKTGNASTPGIDDYGGGGGAGSNNSTSNPYGQVGGTGIVVLRYIPVVKKKRGQPHVNSGGVLIV